MSAQLPDVHREYQEHDSSELTFQIVEPAKPYGALPWMPPGGATLMWYVSEAYTANRFESKQILLSDPCEGEPPIEEVYKILSHEHLHHILEQEIGIKASKKLDDLVEYGNFIVDRQENRTRDEFDDRPLKDEFR